MSNFFIRKLKGYAPLSDEDVPMLASASDGPRKVAAHRDLIREGDQPQNGVRRPRRLGVPLQDPPRRVAPDHGVQ